MTAKPLSLHAPTTRAESPINLDSKATKSHLVMHSQADNGTDIRLIERKRRVPGHWFRSAKRVLLEVELQGEIRRVKLPPNTLILQPRLVMVTDRFATVAGFAPEGSKILVDLATGKTTELSAYPRFHQLADGSKVVLSNSKDPHALRMIHLRDDRDWSDNNVRIGDKKVRRWLQPITSLGSNLILCGVEVANKENTEIGIASLTPDGRVVDYKTEAMSAVALVRQRDGSVVGKYHSREGAKWLSVGVDGKIATRNINNGELHIDYIHVPILQSRSGNLLAVVEVAERGGYSVGAFQPDGKLIDVYETSFERRPRIELAQSRDEYLALTVDPVAGNTGTAGAVIGFAAFGLVGAACGYGLTKEDEKAGQDLWLQVAEDGQLSRVPPAGLA